MNSAVFTQHRSAKIYHPTPVSDEQLKELYEWAKWAPSESNTCPMRLLFIKSNEQKQRLLPFVAAGNQEKVSSAPVTAIVAYDTRFTDHLNKLAPHMNSPTYFDQMPDEAREWAAMRSANLQSGILIAAARSLGLDCGPLGGFDRPGIDQEFFGNSSWKASYLLMLGESDKDQVYPRGPRLDFDEACQII